MRTGDDNRYRDNPRRTADLGDQITLSQAISLVYVRE